MICFQFRQTFLQCLGSVHFFTFSYFSFFPSVLSLKLGKVFLQQLFQSFFLLISECNLLNFHRLSLFAMFLLSCFGFLILYFFLAFLDSRKQGLSMFYQEICALLARLPSTFSMESDLNMITKNTGIPYLFLEVKGDESLSKCILLFMKSQNLYLSMEPYH